MNYIVEIYKNKVSYNICFLNRIKFTAVVFPFLISCSPNNSPKPSVAEISNVKTPAVSSSYEMPDIFLDSLRRSSINADNIHNRQSGSVARVNPYYDEGYENGMEGGYNDGQENVRMDSYDDSCRYKGKKREEYELGYEEGYETGFDDGFADSNFNSEDEE